MSSSNSTVTPKSSWNTFHVLLLCGLSSSWRLSSSLLRIKRNEMRIPHILFFLYGLQKKGNLCIDKNVRSNHFSIVIEYSLGIKIIIKKGLTKSETLAFLRIWSQCGTRRRMDYFHILLEYSSVKTVSKIEKKNW